MPFNPDGTPWGSEASNCKLQDIRAQVVADFQSRDEKRGLGPPEGGQRTTHEVTDEKTGKVSVVIDPSLAGRKASGREIKLVTNKRWAEFRSKPQDEKAYMKERGGTLRDQECAAEISKGREAEEGLKDELAGKAPAVRESRPSRTQRTVAVT